MGKVGFLAFNLAVILPIPFIVTGVVTLFKDTPMTLIEKQDSSGDRPSTPARSTVPLAEMRTLLDRAKPATSAAALNTLQKAFPHVPLKHRLAIGEAYSRTFRREIRDGHDQPHPDDL